MSLPLLVAPSLLAADFNRLGDEVRAVEAAGANVIVAGTSIFGAPDYAAAIAGIREAGMSAA